METVSRDTTYYTSHVHCLPFINQPPSDLTTINTALCFAKEEAKKRNQKNVFVTFDRPLYYEARCLVSQNKELKNMILKLSGFHMLIFFMGANGYT